MPPTAVSAPGKVLLAGGYLVVDQAYTGLVFGLSSRMHVIVDDFLETSDSDARKIIVSSPQFQDAEWQYAYRLIEDGGGVEVTQIKGLSSNKFVETTLAYCLTYIYEAKSLTAIGSTSITILADDDYYSQSQTSTKCVKNERSPFRCFNVPLNKAHKTGLGSSAALVTAFTAALITHYIAPAETVKEWTSNEWTKKAIHSLSQAAHCAAQGKVGSGFDVAAAVYGSCIYRRFSPSILESLGDRGSSAFSTRLKEMVDDNGAERIWDMEIIKSAVNMPKNLRIIMCDVDCGSETPGMVKKVFAWRKKKPEESLLLWETLQRGNEDLAAELQRLAQASSRSYENLESIILTIRSLVREMSEKADVPIEPREQTALLDACSKLPGVAGGVVPGAGGYDALALIVENEAGTLSRLSQFLQSYQEKQGGEQEASIRQLRLLSVKQEMEGLAIEDTLLYKGWLL